MYPAVDFLAWVSSINLAVTSLSDSGPRTLRSAIIQADSGSAGNTYDIRFKVRGTIMLENAQPDLSQSMSLIGPAARRLTVERDPNSASDFGIFVVDAGVNVGISGNTAITGGGLQNGGSGQAELDNSTLNDPSGGGIVNNGVSVHVKNTIVDGVFYVNKIIS